MAYNNQYLLERIVEVQNIVLEHTQKGVSQIWVYRNVIYPRFMISESTFKRYMAINAKKELKKVKN
jgi:hypothetical protein